MLKDYRPSEAGAWGFLLGRGRGIAVSKIRARARGREDMVGAAKKDGGRRPTKSGQGTFSDREL